MPLIPNYIARLRTHSQSTGASSSSHSASNSNSTAGPATPASELARLAADLPVQQPENSSYIARKIHPDPSALLDEDKDEDESVVEDLGPRPPRGRSRSAEQLARQESDPAAAPPPSQRSPLLSRILSVPLLSSVADAEPDSSGTTHWSTFGRRRPPASAIGEFGTLPGSKRSSRRKPSSTTPSTTRPPSSSARTSTPSRTAPSQPNSPTGTVSSSSKSHSQSGHSHSVRSRRPPLVHPEPIPDAEPLDPQTPVRVPFHASPSPDVVSPRAGRATLDDSPQTFGRATPKQPGPSSKPYSPLGGVFVPQSTVTPPQQHSKATGHDPPATYPPRKRTRSRPATGSLVSFPSLPRKRSTARLSVEDVFQTGDPRRFSANWSAAEAVRDGVGEHGETWPATVSREMVRLSLSNGRGGGDPMAVGEVGVLPQGYTKNATLFGSIGEDRRRFMWAGRRRTNISGAPVQLSSSVPRASTLQPAFSISPPPGSGSGHNRTAVGRSGDSGLAPQLSVTAPTPSPSPSGSRFGTMSDPTPRKNSDHNSHSSQSPGKRKMAEAEDEGSPRIPKKSLLGGSKGSSNRASDASYAPSSFRQTKRIRLSTPSHSPEHLSRSISQSSHLSPPGSPRSRPPSSLRTLPNPRSVSQSSIPLRAIISPRPPSIDRRSAYHMRDPALPPSRRQSTQWAGSARKSPDEGLRAFPLQGWAFMLGFVLFPMWWAAAVAPVGWGWTGHTRSVQDGKGVWVKEEDLEAREVWEYDVAFTWRRRCRLMSIIGLLVYIPLIVLLAIFVPRT